MQAAVVWTAVLEWLRQDSTISRASFATWLRQTQLLSCTGGVFVIGVPHRFARDRLERAFREPVERAITACTGVAPAEVRFVVAVPSSTSPARLPACALSADACLWGSPAGSAGPRGTAWSASPAASGIWPAQQLDPRLRFETFVASERNRFALAAARAVAANPGGTYNPLVIYGGSGAGKTHLLHAIGHELLAAQPEARVVLLSALSLASDRSSSAQVGNEVRWRHLAQQADALLLDDVQRLPADDGVSATALSQRAFIQLLDALYTRGRQIVVTADRPPRELTCFEEQVRSRLQMGLVADIASPDVTPAARSRWPVSALWSSRVSDWGQERRSVPGRFGQAGWLECPPAVQVLAAVARYYGMPESVLCGARRHASIVRPRQVAMYLLREACGLSLSEIGALLGGRDHTTVLHGYRQVQRRLARDASLAGEIEAIQRTLRPAMDGRAGLRLSRAAAAD